MPTIRVAKRFTLQTRGERGMPKMVAFEVGDHDVEAAIADNWFVKAHLVGAAEGRLPMPGSPEGNMLLVRVADEARKIAAEAMADRHRAPEPSDVARLPAGDIAVKAAADALTRANERAALAKPAPTPATPKK